MESRSRRRAPWGRLTLALLFVCCAARAEVIYVDPAAPGAERDGRSWPTAYAAIQDAIRVAQPGDTVAVSQGSYGEEITLKGGVWLRGGYGGYVAPSLPPDVHLRPSVISGLGIGPVVYADKNAGGAGIEGFHIAPENYGIKAVSCNQSAPVITGNVIRHAQMAVHCGAGAAPYVFGNLISDCSFGVYCTASSPAVTGNLITDCEYAVHTGNNSSPSILNNTVADNGTGLDFFTGAPDARNNIITRNGTGVYLSGGLPLFFNNCISGNIWDFDGLNDPTGVNGNISDDPGFMDADARNYHLAPLSPCVDAGDDSAVGLPQRDLDGSPRPQGAHVDIGAFEFVLPVAPAADALRICGGLHTSTPSDMDAMDILPPGNIDIVDAVRLNRR